MDQAKQAEGNKVRQNYAEREAVEDSHGFSAFQSSWPKRTTDTWSYTRSVCLRHALDYMHNILYIYIYISYVCEVFSSQRRLFCKAQLQKDFEESREQALREREALISRLHQCDNERAQREGERDEARVQLQSLESKLKDLAPRAAEVSGDGKVEALEMELNLVRARFARESLLPGT